MPTTRLSSKGQVVIPKEVRTALRWLPGAELDIEPISDAIVLRLSPNTRRLPTREELDRVAGCLKYGGPPLSIEEMDRRARKAVGRKWRK